MADTGAESTARLTGWIPLDMKGKPLYAGVNEKERMDLLRAKINNVRVRWNDLEKCLDLVSDIQQAIGATKFDRELHSALQHVLGRERYWADHERDKSPGEGNLHSSVGSGESYYAAGLNLLTSIFLWARETFTSMMGWKSKNQTDEIARQSRPTLLQDREDYAALEMYTTNDGYKKVFGYINQIFRKSDVNETEIYGAVGLVELLTIDLYNFRLANIGCSKLYNFQDIVHRGLSVGPDVLKTFEDLMRQPLQNRNFSVPLAFVSTSTNQARIQEFLDKTEKGRFRMHWKIHVHGLEPKLLAQYHSKHPQSVVTTICAMPISHVSEFANEQEVLLRGPFFQILRMYEEQAGEHQVHVAEMVMLNANRDHGSELAEHHGEKELQRKHFGQICAASRYEICASLAQKYGLPEADGYRDLADTMLSRLSADHFEAPFNPGLSDSWSTPRPSWIGASLSSAFPKSYSERRRKFSVASFGGTDWSTVKEIIDQEYAWQKGDWCNVPRLYGQLISYLLGPKTSSYICTKYELGNTDDGIPFLNTEILKNSIGKYHLSLSCSIPSSKLSKTIPSRNFFSISSTHSNNPTETAEEAVRGSGFTLLHQAAFNNADPSFVEDLIQLGAWRRCPIFAPPLSPFSLFCISIKSWRRIQNSDLN